MPGDRNQISGEGNGMFDTRYALSPQRRMLLATQSLMQELGLAAAYNVIRATAGATILMYHSIAAEADALWIDPRNRLPPAAFRRQMAFLARHRRVVSMDELASSIRAGVSLPRGCVVITLDDGYRDALTEAAPILAEYGLPATLYLATGYVSRTENQWIDQLYALFASRTRDEIHMPWENEARSLGNTRASLAAYHKIARKLIVSSHEERASILAELDDRLRPSRRPPRLTLCWDEVRILRRQYPLVGIGGHTRDHIDLTSASPAEAKEEIEACSRDITDTLGERPRHFSFPYNRSAPGLESALERIGFETAASSGPDTLIGTGTPRFSLPRIEAPYGYSRLKFYTSGAYPGLSLALTGKR